MGKGILFKNKLLLLLFLLNIAIILIPLGCSKGNEPEDNKANFGLYLLEDQSITWEDLKTRNLNSLKLKEWITSDKIDFYDYSTHVIYLNVDYNTLFAVPHNDNTPFVVVANNKRCYYGRFSPPKDTTQPHVVIKPLELCNDLIMLEFNPPHRKDIRVNEDVKKALVDLKIIKKGLDFNFESIYLKNEKTHQTFGIMYQYNNSEESSIYFFNRAYIIKLKNTYFRSKIVLYNEEHTYSFLGINGDTSIHKLTLLDYEQTNDFYLFCENASAGKSSEYAISGVFPREIVETGSYYCYSENYFSMGGNLRKRYTPTGRILIGYHRSSTQKVKYDNENGFTLIDENVELR